MGFTTNPQIATLAPSHRFGRNLSFQVCPSIFRSCRDHQHHLLIARRQKHPAVKLPHVRHRAAIRASYNNRDADEDAIDVSAPSNVASLNNWKVFWTAIDASAWLGTLGTAAAYVITQEVLLAGGPIILLIIAFFASKQRENVDTLVARSELERRVQQALQRASSLSKSNATELAASLNAELATLAGELKKAGPDKTLRQLENKVSTLEGSILSASTATRETLKVVESQQVRLACDVAARTESIRKDVSSQVAAASQEELSAIGRLESRLMAVESALSNLESSQDESFRRLSSNLSTAFDDTELALQAAVRSETWKSLESVRQLPQILAAMVPPVPTVVDIEKQLPEITEESIRLLIEQQLAVATSEIADQQRILLEELKTLPQSIDPSQWNQLGRKLLALEQQLATLTTVAASTSSQTQLNGAELKGEALSQNGASSASLSSEEELKAMLQGMRTEISSLTQAVQAALSEQQQQLSTSSASSLSVPQATSSSLSSIVQLQTALVTIQSALKAVKNGLKEVLSETAAAAGSNQTETNGFDVNIDQEQRLLRLEIAIDAALAPAFTALEDLTEGVAVDEGNDKGLSQVLSSLAALNERLDSLTAPVGSQQEQERTTSGAVHVDKEPSFAEVENKDVVQGNGSNPSVTAGDAIATANEGGSTPLEPESGGSSGVPISAWLVSADDYEEVSSVRQPEYEDVEEQKQQRGQENEFKEILTGEGSVADSYDSSATFSMEYMPLNASYNANFDSGGDETSTVNAAVLPLDKEQEAETKEVVVEESVAMAAAVEQTEGISSRSDTEPPPTTVGMEAESSSPSAPEDENTSVPAVPAELEDLGPEELYDLGMVRLKEARKLAAAALDGEQGGDLGLADGACSYAEACFEQLLLLEPDNIKALGNCGNVLMTKGRLRKQMLQAVRSAAAVVSSVSDPATSATMAASIDRLSAEAQELLLLAGRKYKRVLELDPDQARAFINWGRVVCLRAELEDERGDPAAAAALFSNAADKFDAALDIDPTNSTVMRLAGTALLESGVRVLQTEDAREGRRLVKDAEGYLRAAVAAVPSDGEGVEKLERCERVLEATRPTRR